MVREYVLAILRDQADPHARLPTERLLSEQLGVSRLTVRRALERLASEGRVYRVQGAGTFVAEPAIRKGHTLSSFTEDMTSRGLTATARLLVAEETDAGAHHSWKLGISPGEPLVHVTRLRLADNVPICLEEVHIVKRFAPDLLEQSLDGSLYDLLSGKYQIVLERAEQEVTATVLDPADARRLGVAPHAPALLVERVTYDTRGRAVELARSLYRGDRYSFENTLRRNG
jgi:GntR family transcriptional regulator